MINITIAMSKKVMIMENHIIFSKPPENQTIFCTKDRLIELQIASFVKKT